VEDAQDILESVQTEGDTQIGRVQAKGNEIIDSLPDDFTEIQNELNALNGSLVDVKADLADVENEINTKTEVHPVPSISFSGNTSNSDPLVVTTGGYVYFRNFESAYTTMRSVSCGASYSISNGDVLFYDILTRTLSISGSNSDVIDDNHVALLWKHGTFIKGAWAVYYYEYVLNAAYPGVKEYAEQNRSLFDVTPFQAISFSGNETASDPLIVSTGGYYLTRNYDSNVGTCYRTRSCDATYTINNGYGLFYKISTNALSIIQVSTMPSDDYIVLLFKNSTTIKGLWAVYYNQKNLIAKFNGIGAFSKNYTRASKTVGSFYSAFADVQIVEGRTYEINVNTGSDTGTVILTTAANINSASIVQTLGIKKSYIFTANATQATALYVGCYIKAENTDPAVIDIYVNDLSNKYNAPVLHNYQQIEQISRVQQPIPDYFNSYLDGKITDINDAMAQSYNMDAYIFVTDNHITKNSLTSFPVMREILAHTAVDKVIYNGDVVYAYGSNADILKAANLNLKEFKGLTPYGRVFMNRGNHDFTIKNTGAETGYTYGTAFTYEYLTKMMEPYANVTPGKMYWYYDNPVQKIRYIGVDTTDSQTEGATPWGVNVSFSQEQVNWLCEKLNVENGWSVVVTGHIPVLSGNETTRLGVLAAILKAYANKTVCSASYDGVTCSQDFSNYKGTLVCYMCGHTHIDGTTTSDGVLEIRTTCDAMITDDGSTRTYGTTTEMAIDVVVIDKDNETISTIRVGSGSDRNFSY